VPGPPAAPSVTWRYQLAPGAACPYLVATQRKARAAMLSLVQIFSLLLDIVWFVVIAHIILSWLINFQVLNLRQPLVAQIWDGLNRLLEPLYNRIRRILPPMSGLDLAPLVVLIGIYIIRILLRNNLGYFV
jgi:YggT family protein